MLRFLLYPYLQWRYRRVTAAHSKAFHERNAASARGDTREVGRLTKVVQQTLTERIRLEQRAGGKGVFA